VQLTVNEWLVRIARNPIDGSRLRASAGTVTALPNVVRMRCFSRRNRFQIWRVVHRTRRHLVAECMVSARMDPRRLSVIPRACRSIRESATPAGQRGPPSSPNAALPAFTVNAQGSSSGPKLSA